MFAIHRSGAMLLAMLFLAACGSADKPPPVEETVFRDVVVTPQEKAKNVQNVVDEQKRALDEAVRRNENDE